MGAVFSAMKAEYVVGSSPTVGAVFSAMKAEYVVGSSPTVRAVFSAMKAEYVESYSGSRFFGDESRVCFGCGSGSPFRPSLFISHKV